MRLSGNLLLDAIARFVLRFRKHWEGRHVGVELRVCSYGVRRRWTSFTLACGISSVILKSQFSGMARAPIAASGGEYMHADKICVPSTSDHSKCIVQNLILADQKIKDATLDLEREGFRQLGQPAQTSPEHQDGWTRSTLKYYFENDKQWATITVVDTVIGVTSVFTHADYKECQVNDRACR